MWYVESLWLVKERLEARDWRENREGRRQGGEWRSVKERAVTLWFLTDRDGGVTVNLVHHKPSFRLPRGAVYAPSIQEEKVG